MTSILKIKDKNGNWIDIPAIKGDKPIKGVDYWTEEDKTEIINEVNEYVDEKISGTSGGNQEPVDIFPTLEFTVGYLLNGGFHTDSSAYKTTVEYIPLKKGEKVIFSNGTFRIIEFYNSDKSFKESSPKGVTEYSYTATEDCYFRICIANNGSSTNHSVVIYPIEKMECEYKNMLTGKKWYVCGDSYSSDSGYSAYPDIPEEDYKFTEGLYSGEYKVYPFFIGRRCGIEVHNLAVSGKTIICNPETEDGTKLSDIINDNRTAKYQYYNSFTNINQTGSEWKFYTYEDIPKDADYVTLLFGGNDSKVWNSLIGQIPIEKIIGSMFTETGEINYDISTFYGAYNTILHKLVTERPLTHIGIFISPIISAEMAEATRDIATKWGVPYLDLTSDPQVPLLFRTLKGKTGVASTPSGGNGTVLDEVIIAREDYFQVSDSNLHPTYDCHEYMSYFIESWLMRI